MDLNIIWFVLITVLFTGFLFLEGFDYGVGILHLFVAKEDWERRAVMNSIGPVWDGNEVWMITAGGAMFAAFPHWYATLFSGFYLALFLMLAALIFRGVSFEFRSKSENPQWRKIWDISFFAGSLIPALLWGVAFANIVRGLAIDAKMNYIGTFWDLLNPYGLVGGLATLTLFTLHGATYLALKTEGVIRDRARAIGQKVFFASLVFALAFVAYSAVETDMFKGTMLAGIVAVLAGLAIVLVFVMMKSGKDGMAFLMSSLAVVFVTLSLFMTLFPRVMVSSLDAKYSLTIYNASSSPYTLKVMFIVALIFTPLVLLYQGWTFYIFRKRITQDTHMEY